jgi:thiamine-monophosphate kinase
MIDLSDGLSSDLPRLAKASSTGFEVDREHLPLNKGCSIERAISDGEDYELLFAVSPGAAPTLEERWNKRFPTLALTHIGRLTEPSAQKPHAPGFDQLTDSGYDHFRVTEKK